MPNYNKLIYTRAEADALLALDVWFQYFWVASPIVKCIIFPLKTLLYCNHIRIFNQQNLSISSYRPGRRNYSMRKTVPF
jgi:hypothetical protein